MRCVSKRKLLLCLVTLGALLGVQAAHAHNEFEGSVPAADAKLETSPRTIVLNFTRAVTPVNVSLVDAGGIPVESVGDVFADGDSVVLSILDPLPPGMYRVSFHVLSGDAHTVSGDFSFALTAPTPAGSEASGDAAPESPAGPAVEAARPVIEQTLISASRVETAVRALFIALLLMAVGLVTFGLAIALPDTLKSWLVVVVRRTAAFGLLVTIGYFLIAVLAIAGLDAFRAQPLYVVLRTSLGTSLLLALVGFLLLAVPVRAQRVWAGIGIALLLTSRVVTGHPASQDPMFLLVPSMAVHVVAAGFWFASLWVLLRLLRKGPLADAPRILAEFARIAIRSVGVLLVVGIVMAVVHLKSFDALLHTEYGITLLWKIAGVSGLLALAVVNKTLLTPRLTKSFEPTALKTSIRLEAAVMLAVIVISTVLAATSPATSPDSSASKFRQTETPIVVSDLDRASLITNRGGHVEQ